jgi:hypothetical protein
MGRRAHIGHITPLSPQCCPETTISGPQMAKFGEKKQIIKINQATRWSEQALQSPFRQPPTPWKRARSS